MDHILKASSMSLTKSCDVRQTKAIIREKNSNKSNIYEFSDKNTFPDLKGDK